MAPSLPISLSPHVCILASQDLIELLAKSSLPPLPHVLQSFSPLPQVTTRTTSLTSVQHSSFALRFSELLEVEAACREDEEQRALRTLDWISDRIHNRCPRWVEEMEKVADREIPRTPWWDELRRCVEGDTTPSKTEAWNHPVAVILAVSTTAPNPLQAVTALHARQSEFPAWVDGAYLRYTLIVHPSNSTLSDEEAGALYNAVKKQFGLTSYLLPLSLPDPPPAPVPVPALLPRLPPQTLVESPNPDSTEFNSLNGAVGPISGPPPSDPVNTIRMNEADIQQVGKFVREFLVMNVVPWMEKCVLEWNENFSSTRRLPSRLFSSTRRLFGNSAATPPPTHNSSSSLSSLPMRSQSVQVTGTHYHPPTQHRRLAEFATILGDLKLAVTVWENLRKESKGASDILPLLLSPSPATQLHVSNSLAAIHAPSRDPPPQAQLRSLLYGVRWEGAIQLNDFVGEILEGEKWLVWAAGSAEELPSALLLGHAALLSSRKQRKRRAALWYSMAATRLEKCGVKPLTMYYLRRAHDLSRNRPQKHLSPSFWEGEGKTPEESPGLGCIIAGIEHPLGRLLYTTGDVQNAVRMFLGLLNDDARCGSSAANGLVAPEGITLGNDKLYLDDFRVAFNHFQSMGEDEALLAGLKPSFSICIAHKTAVRIGMDMTSSEGWQGHEEAWKTFQKGKGRREGLVPGGKALVGDIFWVDLVLRNPLDTELTVSNLTLVIHDSSGAVPSYIEVECLNEVVLEPKDQRTVPLSVKSSKAASLVIAHATYNFLSLLPCSEPLVSRGCRLHDTLAQRITPTYAPNVTVNVQVVERSHKLTVNFVDDGYLSLAHGETRAMSIWISNEGTETVDELWMVSGAEDELWVGTNEEARAAVATSEVFTSPNSLQRQVPWQIPLSNAQGEECLRPSESMELPILLHATGSGEQELKLMLVYRNRDSQDFYTRKVVRDYEVLRLLNVGATAQPAPYLDDAFSVALDIQNTSSANVRITQISLISPQWRCEPLVPGILPLLLSNQVLHLSFGARQWTEAKGTKETLEFVSNTMTDVLNGRSVNNSKLPPSLDLICTHAVEPDKEPYSVLINPTRSLIQTGRSNHVVHSLEQMQLHIPQTSYPYVIPLYHPNALDFVIYWEVASQQRTGHIFVSGLNVGAQHAGLSDIIEKARNAKVKRNMYAETDRERMEILNAAELSEWNSEMNPTTLVVQGAEMITHDFNKGPLAMKVPFVVRNHSLTHKARYALRLQPQHTDIASHTIDPPYTGRCTFRGDLAPNAMATVKPSLWITRPGVYNLAGWVLETEVLEANGDAVRQHYVQEAIPSDGVVLIVVGASPS